MTAPDPAPRSLGVLASSRRLIPGIHDACRSTAEAYGRRATIWPGANITAFGRAAGAMLAPEWSETSGTR